jgi:hypothetical protein
MFVDFYILIRLINFSVEQMKAEAGATTTRNA